MKGSILNEYTVKQCLIHHHRRDNEEGKINIVQHNVKQCLLRRHRDNEEGKINIVPSTEIFFSKKKTSLVELCIHEEMIKLKHYNGFSHAEKNIS